MIVRAPRPKGNFTVIPNDVLTDLNLGWRAKGLLCYLLSKPDNWKTHTTFLASIGPDGRDSIRAALAQLEKAGYIRRRRYQDSRTGQWRYDTVVFDSARDAAYDDFLTSNDPVDNPEDN